MGMNAGATDTIEFFGWDSTKRTARFTGDAGGGNIIVTKDPRWIDSERGELVWLEYLNSNGDRYRATCQCSTTNGNTVAKIQTEHNGRTVDTDGILIKDWDGNIWTADVRGFPGEGPKPVTFFLTSGVLPNH